MRLDGKTALITGGNSGIGLATARTFIHQGAKVAITGRDQSTLDDAARSLGANAVAFRADIMDSAASEAAIRTAAERFGHLDIVVANAGISGNTPVGGTSAEQFERILTTNVTGVFLRWRRSPTRFCSWRPTMRRIFRGRRSLSMAG
jgi:NAD(P)-dependent dehydrogenase (short-subunit alcohol dehydrogenase family)